MLWITRWAPHPDNLKANFNVLAQANQLLMSTLSTSATSSPNLLTKQKGPVVITENIKPSCWHIRILVHMYPHNRS